MRKKEIKMQLEVVIPQEQLVEYGKLLSMENQRKCRVESEKQAANSSFKASIDDCQSQIEKYSQLISSGREMKPVKCEIFFNSPVEGSKETYRLDTMERIRIEQMTEDEMHDLFINGLGLQEEEDGTLSFVFNDKKGVPVVDRDADDFSSVGWKTINGPITDDEMVKLELHEGEFRVVKGNTNGYTVYSLQRKEEVKELPEAKPEKKKSAKKETAAAAVAPERCDFIHDKTNLRCIMEKGHAGNCNLNACKHQHEDGIQFCVLVAGHEGDHKFMNPEDLK